MPGYRVVLETNYNDEVYDIEFDKVDAVTITSNSSITSSPIVTGDVIADHMYRNPISVSVRGTFSLYGNQPAVFRGDYEDRLTNIQDFFEKLKNSGTFINMVTRCRDNDQSERFLVRNNLVLDNITWTQYQSSVDFSFGFTEVINVNVEETDYEVDVTDPNIPAQTDAFTQSFTDTLLPLDNVVNIVNKILEENYLIDGGWNGLMQWLQKVGSAYVESMKQGISYTITGALVGVGIKILLSAAALSSPAGWIIIGGAALIGAIYGVVKGLVEGWKRKEAEQTFMLNAFKFSNADGSSNEQECERYANYIGTVVDNITQLNNYVQVYSISSNENQECLCYINNYYYVFRFIKNNTTEKWSLDIISINENNLLVYSSSEIQGLSNISECNKETALGYNSTNSKGFQIYLINDKLEEANTNGWSDEEIREVSKDLTNYYILVSQIDMGEFTNTLANVIYNAMTY